MARLIWTEPALHDLEIIAECIALDKPDAARRYVKKVFVAVEELERFPNAGSVPPEIRHLPFRQLVIPPCRIFCRVAGDHVFILYVMRAEQHFHEDMLEERGKKTGAP
jgi:toxin ParE1/3/4